MTLGCLLSVAAVAVVREASPFIREATNVLLVISQFQILLTFLSAFIIASDALADLGVSPVELGVLLLGANCAIIGLASATLIWRWQAERRVRKWRSKLTVSELAALQSVMAGDAGGLSVYDLEDEQRSKQLVLSRVGCTTSLPLDGPAGGGGDGGGSLGRPERGSVDRGSVRGTIELRGGGLLSPAGAAVGTAAPERAPRALVAVRVRPGEVVLLRALGGGNGGPRGGEMAGAAAFGGTFLGSCRGAPALVRTLSAPVTPGKGRRFGAALAAELAVVSACSGDGDSAAGVTASGFGGDGKGDGGQGGANGGGHANVVTLTGVCLSADLTALCFEWCKGGGSLADLLRGGGLGGGRGIGDGFGHLLWRDPLLRLAVEAATGLDHLHATVRKNAA